MTAGTATPDRAEFRRLVQAGQSVVPVTRRLLADGSTPVGLYRTLAAGRPGTFLLESAEHGRVWSRYSFVGVHSAGVLTSADGVAAWVGDGVPARLVAETAGRPTLDALRRTTALLRTPRRADLPPLSGGLVGSLSYDAVRAMERLPATSTDDLGLPDLAMMLVTDLAVLDHHDGSVLLIADALLPADADAAYDDAVARLDAMATALAGPTPSGLATLDTAAPIDAVRRTESAEFQASVEVAKEHIRAGDAFQIVVSQRFETDCAADPLDVYRVLRVTNPSPYMYLLRMPGGPGGEAFDIVGSSPEALVKVVDGRAMTHPIAGTRWRGATPEEDAAIAAGLLADPKERSEHVMLVDLGRNDLGRVCAPGTVEVVDFMSVERYSHVMHIVSTVVGRVRDGLDAVDVLTACFPAGTLSGAPKVRAMEIIESLEPTRRGLYGGCVGYLDLAGDLDTAIAIRTAVLRGGRAYVQAGAGIVADSDPASEDLECRNKAAAVLSALAAAATMRPVAPAAGETVAPSDVDPVAVA